MFDPDVLQAVSVFLETHGTLSLATADVDGVPYAANVQYVSDDDWHLYWVSKPAAAHSLNLLGRPQSAVSVYAPVGGPAEIHGVQMRGLAEELADGREVAEVLSRYTAKYPFTADPPFSEAVAAQMFYRFRPSWIRWIDNRRGFGWSVEETL